MALIKFYLRILAVALTHSLEKADLLAGILAVLGGALTYFNPELTQAVGLGLWAISLAFFLILFAVRLFLSPYWIFRDEQKARAKSDAKLQKLLTSRPVIQCVKTRKAPMFRPSPVVENKVPAGELIQAWFENRPPIPTESSVARQITTIISFREFGSMTPLFEVHGQWAESTAPDHIGYSGTTPTLDLNPGTLYAKLMIALKYPSEPDAFAYSAESMRAYYGGRNPNMRLPPGKYDLAVQIRGINVDREFQFVLSNSGDETGLGLAFNSEVRPG